VAVAVGSASAVVVRWVKVEAVTVASADVVVEVRCHYLQQRIKNSVAA